MPGILSNLGVEMAAVLIILSGRMSACQRVCCFYIVRTSRHMLLGESVYQVMLPQALEVPPFSLAVTCVLKKKKKHAGMLCG